MTFPEARLAWGSVRPEHILMWKPLPGLCPSFVLEPFLLLLNSIRQQEKAGGSPGHRRDAYRPSTRTGLVYLELN